MIDESLPRTRPFAADSVDWVTFAAGARFGLRYRPLTRSAAGGDYRVGLSIEELEPGRQGAPTHYHVREEEHLLILDGEVDVRIGARTYRMRAGDFVSFPAGQRAGHSMVNPGPATCRYLMIGENDPNEVAVYTDSGKALVRPLGRRAILDLLAARDYWHGEATGDPAPDPLVPDIRGDALTPEAEPRPPVSSDAVPWDVWGRGGDYGGRARHLSRAAAGPSYRVGVLIQEIEPGLRMCRSHYHTLEEEQALVLSGRPTLILGEERLAMSPGDYVYFPPGTAVGHAFVNEGAEPCRILTIGERNPADVCVYPVWGKVKVAGLGPGGTLFDIPPAGFGLVADD